MPSWCLLLVGLLLLGQAVANPLYAADFRFEGSLGGASGSTSGTANFAAGKFLFTVTSDALGGRGLAPGAAIWVDGPLAAWLAEPVLSNVSFGLEYQRFRNAASSTVSTTLAGTPVPVSAAVSLGSGLTSHNLMANAAWRYNAGNMHPFLGAGGGVAVTQLNANLGLSTTPALPGTTPASLSGGVIKATAAGQVFAGFDYDLTPNIYAGITGKYYFTDTIRRNFTHTQYSVDTSELAILGHVGVKF